MRIIFVLKVQESLKPFIRGPLTKKYLDIKIDNFRKENEYKLIKKLNSVLKYLKVKFSSVEPSIELIDPQQRLEIGLTELSRSTQSDLQLIRESISHQLTDVEYKLTNSQQRIADCLIEMNTKNTTNFETTKEESSDSLELVQVKLEKFLDQNFFDLKRLTNVSFSSARQSFKKIISNFEEKTFLKFKDIKQYLEGLYNFSKNNQEENKKEFNDIKQSIISLATKLDQANYYLEKISDKLKILESTTDLQFHKAKSIQNSLDETIQKIEHQKLALEQLPKYQPKIIINNLKESSIRRSIMDLFNQNIHFEGKNEASKKNDDIGSLNDLFKNESQIIEEESMEIKPKQLTKLDQHQHSVITDISNQTIKELQNEAIKETKFSELKTEDQSEKDNFKSELDTLSNISPWLKRRLKQKERKNKNEIQPEEPKGDM